MKLKNLYHLKPEAIHEGSVRAWRLFQGSDFQSNVSFINVDMMEPGAAVELHQHDDLEETCYILSGLGEVQVGDEVQQIREGDAVYLPPHLNHSIRNQGSYPLRFLVVAAAIPRR